MHIRRMLVAAAILNAITTGGLRARAEDTPAAWKVEADAAANNTVAAPGGAAATTGTALDPYRGRAPLALATTSPFFNTLTLPSPPSKYALLSGGTGYELWNLKTGAKEKLNGPRIAARELVLSQDGQYAAGMADARSNGADIFSLRTDKVVSHITLNGRVERILGFAGSSKLALTMAEPQASLAIFNVSDGSTVGTVPLDGKISGEAFSPNGKYLALVTGGLGKADAVSMIDAVHGKSAGVIHLTQEANRPMSLGTFAGFSPDGRELAIVRQYPGIHATTQTTIISATTGAVILEKSAEEESAGLPAARNGSEPVLWSPDAAHLIAGVSVIDRATLSVGENLASGADAFNILGVRWADPSNIVLFERQGTSIKTTMHTLGKKGDDVAAGGTATRPGAHPAAGPEAEKPEAAVEDVSGAPVVTMSGAKGIALAEAPGGELALPAMVGEKGKLMADMWHVADMENAEFGERVAIDRLMFTGEEAHLMFVEESLGSISQHRKRTLIQRFDLVSGSAGPTLSVDGDVAAADVSPTGNTIALLAGEKKDTVKIYRFKDRAYKLDDAHGEFHPFGVAEAGGNLPGNTPNAVGAAELVDDTHLLAMSSQGKLVLVDLQNLSAVWTADKAVQRRGLGVSQPGPALSPDHTVAAICLGSGTVFVDALTGKALGKLEAPENATPEFGVFSQDATRLAVASQRGQEMILSVYDLKTGKRVAEGAASLNPGGFGAREEWLWFLSPDFVMTSRGDVFSVKRGAPVWRYAVPAVSFGSMQPARRFVYPASESRPMAPLGRGARGGMPTGPSTALQEVVSAQLPHAEVTKVAAKSDDELYVWHPHMSVKLDVTVTGDEAFKQAQLEIWKKDFEAEGFTVDGDSPNVLHANSFLMAGPATTYQGNRGESFSVSRNLVGYTMSLNVGGKDLWQVTFDKPPANSLAPMVVMLSVKPGESAQQAADRENPPLTQASQVILPPAFIAREGEIGTTMLGPKGPETTPGAGRGDLPTRGAGPGRGPLRGNEPTRGAVPGPAPGRNGGLFPGG